MSTSEADRDLSLVGKAWDLGLSSVSFPREGTTGYPVLDACWVLSKSLMNE